MKSTFALSSKMSTRHSSSIAACAASCLSDLVPDYRLRSSPLLGPFFFLWEATRYGVGIMLDIHAIAGSQNGVDNSGQVR